MIPGKFYVAVFRSLMQVSHIWADDEYIKK